MDSEITNNSNLPFCPTPERPGTIRRPSLPSLGPSTPRNPRSCTSPSPPRLPLHPRPAGSCRTKQRPTIAVLPLPNRYQDNWRKDFHTFVADDRDDLLVCCGFCGQVCCRWCLGVGGVCWSWRDCVGVFGQFHLDLGKIRKE